ncbi:hypothetical protein XENTR_v10019459 [Xenopus tropicalis]|uniref:Guanylate binding protein family member 6 n=1 Tax=Xenopus tropicalis TaxID=8364 RepID=B1WBJ6_XENTR|nr:guanylate binding protein family member 6 [Xenopus tropicalis]XP_031760693.1 guanylate binding protein family member 6 isoform X1 [Xenopus tropicalis]XP_031760694.1 guanylate binding protein family member 6 isoform X1 [Xenopus tropicalis]AAI61780.1 LOC100145795 protein [Xenopus tropicalis]KAE8594144.1 hypothetical protein XENTR_v10019459 [Xenopus tropicalis]|eukprot:NP_001120628.1 guanylate binding protein family member 6 [Xenopus tropicalis]
MSRGVVMSHPVCLIENQNTPEGYKLVINQKAVQILEDITEPVVPVAIVGKYRTGKSYLMNKLAGSNDGFALGSTIQSKTKGIWMWCVPHPHKPGHTLVLLDTEGLGDVEKGDRKNDSWVFSLAVLLSSTLVYNSVGTIDQESLEKLHYVTELTERIKLKAKTSNDDDESAEFKRTFPSFIWCVRDFTLKLEQEGKQITEDEYLQMALNLKPGFSKAAREYNFPRECITHFFHSHKCFVFERPASTEDLQRLEELSESQLEPRFVKQAHRFCDFVFNNSQTKTLAGGHCVTGRMLGTLAVTYVESIRSGSVPCMENAVLALAQIENTAAIQKALSVYEAEMKQAEGTFPTETQDEFLSKQTQCEKKAVKVFMDRSFKDDKREYQGKLMGDLQQKHQEFAKRNEEASIHKCQDLLQVLSANLEKGIKNVVFSKPGGHKQYLKEKQKIMDTYNNSPGKGIKAALVLQQFIEGKKNIEMTVLQADESLTKQQKEMEEEKMKKEAAEKKLQEEKENARQLERTRKEQTQRLEQQAIMLKEKLEEERHMLLKENEWMIKEKMKEREKLAQEGLHNKAGMLGEQVNALQHQNNEISSPNWILEGIGTLVEVASLALPGAFGKAATVVSSFIRRIF